MKPLRFKSLADRLPRNNQKIVYFYGSPGSQIGRFRVHDDGEYYSISHIPWNGDRFATTYWVDYYKFWRRIAKTGKKS